MKKLYSFLTKPYHFLVVTLALASFSFAIYNFGFWQHIFTIFSGNELSFSFKVLSVLAVYALYLAISILLFSYKLLIKPVFILLFLINAIASYMVNKYGILFDISMIENIFQTNPQEATSYFSLTLFIYFLALGVLPSILLLKLNISYPSFKKTWLQRLSLIIGLLAFTSIITKTYYQPFSFIGRQNKYIIKKILPFAYIVATWKTVKAHYFTTPPKYIVGGKNAKTVSTTDKKLSILVVGETARIYNYGYYGYKNNTNKYTQDLNLINFKDVRSCGTATAYSVPCMLTNLTRANFSIEKAKYRDNLLDIARKAGVNLIWFDNNGGCKGMCDRIKHIYIKPNNPKFCRKDYCYDEILVEETKKELQKAYQENKDSLIILHIIGSHGPRYYERYPKRFTTFTPECRRADVENCELSTLRNTYDNTILYTDFILSRLINELKVYENERATSLFYISDHGESLGEDGAFLHGFPYVLAPKEQKQVPLQLYFGKNTLKAMQIDENCLRNKVDDQLSHDNVFHTLLSLLQIQTDEYQAELDILSSCKKTKQK